jgi:hypothetical protein
MKKIETISKNLIKFPNFLLQAASARNAIVIKTQLKGDKKKCA